MKNLYNKLKFISCTCTCSCTISENVSLKHILRGKRGRRRRSRRRRKRKKKKSFLNIFSFYFIVLLFLSPYFFPLRWNTILSILLVADTQFYKRLCPSVYPSVRWSRSTARVVTLELKTRKTRIFDASVGDVCVCVGGGRGCGWGEAGGWMLLPNRLQRYCDPASLVFSCPVN